MKGQIVKSLILSFSILLGELSCQRTDPPVAEKLDIRNSLTWNHKETIETDAPDASECISPPEIRHPPLRVEVSRPRGRGSARSITLLPRARRIRRATVAYEPTPEQAGSSAANAINWEIHGDSLLFLPQDLFHHGRARVGLFRRYDDPLPAPSEQAVGHSKGEDSTLPTTNEVIPLSTEAREVARLSKRARLFPRSKMMRYASSVLAVSKKLAAT